MKRIALFGVVLLGLLFIGCTQTQQNMPIANPSPVCGNGILESEESCENNADCENSGICSACKCELDNTTPTQEKNLNNTPIQNGTSKSNLTEVVLPPATLSEENCTTDKTLSSCAGYPDSAKDGCYEEVAVATNNIQGCNIIKNDFDYDYCYFYIAINTRNVELCDSKDRVRYPESVDKTGKTSCYTAYAEGSGNTNACKLITAKLFDARCFGRAGIKDANDCASTYRDECYGRVARAKNDANICKLIQWNYTKTSCEKDIRSWPLRDDKTTKKRCPVLLNPNETGYSDGLYYSKIIYK